MISLPLDMDQMAMSVLGLKLAEPNGARHPPAWMDGRMWEWVVSMKSYTANKAIHACSIHTCFMRPSMCEEHVKERRVCEKKIGSHMEKQGR